MDPMGVPDLLHMLQGMVLPLWAGVPIPPASWRDSFLFFPDVFSTLIFC